MSFRGIENHLIWQVIRYWCSEDIMLVMLHSCIIMQTLGVESAPFLFGPTPMILCYIWPHFFL